MSLLTVSRHGRHIHFKMLSFIFVLIDRKPAWLNFDLKYTTEEQCFRIISKHDGSRNI